MNIYALLIPKTYAILRDQRIRFYGETLPDFIKSQPYSPSVAKFMLKKALENL